jgi:hypothetical protein
MHPSARDIPLGTSCHRFIDLRLSLHQDISQGRGFYLATKQQTYFCDATDSSASWVLVFDIVVECSISSELLDVKVLV